MPLNISPCLHWAQMNTGATTMLTESSGNGFWSSPAVLM